MENLAGGIELLKILLRKESASACAYRTRDYLGLAKRAGLQQPRASSNCSRPGSSTFYSPFTAPKRQQNDFWEMSTQGRWQVGQWFYRSK